MTFDWLVVGAGIHGTYIARELLESGIERERVALLDRSGEFLGAFKRKARACGMDALRSTFVQHVGPDPFGLETFAEGRGRGDELRPTPNHPPRPSLALFLDHAEHVIERSDLGRLLRERTVTGIEYAAEGYAVGTDDGTVRARNVVLAVGPGDRYRRPDWASNADGIEHVWDADERPERRIKSDERVCVIGGGVTAGQFATSVADTAGEVLLRVREPIEESTTEADPRWINWRHIERQLHSLPPGSKARYERVQEARNGGTMPTYLARKVREAANVRVRRGEVMTASAGEGRHSVLSEDGGIDRVDRIVLATGFRPVYDRPLVGAIADSLGLERGYRGVPVLEDTTMAWRRHDGRHSRLFVTGALAACTAGPLAGNIHGARRAADRIVGETTTLTPKPA